MKKVPIQELTPESFRDFGSFSSAIDINRPCLGEPGGIVTFYRDMEILELGQIGSVAFSATYALKRPFVIDAMESHSNTGEALMPIDGDVLIHVAPASRNDPCPMDKIQVFLVPKGTIVTLRKGVWHCAPFPYTTESVHIMVALPERTYANDCYFYLVPKEDQVEIIVED